MIECVDKFTFYLLGWPRMRWPQCWTTFSHFPEFLDWFWSFLMINIFRYSCRYYLINYNIRQLISYMVNKQTRGVCKMSQRRRLSQGINYRQLSLSRYWEITKKFGLAVSIYYLTYICSMTRIFSTFPIQTHFCTKHLFYGTWQTNNYSV